MDPFFAFTITIAFQSLLAPMIPQPICVLFMSPKGGTRRIHSLGRHDTGPSFCIQDHRPPTNPHTPPRPYPSAPMTPEPICLLLMFFWGSCPKTHSLLRSLLTTHIEVFQQRMNYYGHAPQALAILIYKKENAPPFWAPSFPE